MYLLIFHSCKIMFCQNLAKFQRSKKYCKNTWLLEFENKHFPCLTSLYIRKTEQKKTESRMNYDFFVHINRRIAGYTSHGNHQQRPCPRPNTSTKRSLYPKLRTSTLPKPTHYTLFNNQRDSKHKNGSPKTIQLHLNNMFMLELA